MGTATLEVEPGVLRSLLPPTVQKGQVNTLSVDKYAWAWYMRPEQPSEYEQLKAQIVRSDGSEKAVKTKDLNTIKERILQIEDEDAQDAGDRIVRLPADGASRPHYEAKGFLYVCASELLDAQGRKVPVARPTVEQAFDLIDEEYGARVDEARAKRAEFHAKKETAISSAVEAAFPAPAQSKGRKSK